MNEIDLSAQTYARLWKITCSNGEIFTLTDHDEDLEFLGDSYNHCRAFQGFDIEKSLGAGAESSALGSFLDVEFISEEDILAGKFEDAEVVHFLVNWKDLGDHKLIFKGKISRARCFESYFEFEFLSPLDILNTSITTKSLLRRCSAGLGDAACKVHMAQPQYQFETEVFSVNGAEVEFVTSQEFTDDWFVHGSISCVDDTFSNFSSQIISQQNQGDRIRLALLKPLPSKLEIGARIRVEAGCDKCFSTCRDKFNNHLNFRGFPHLPRDEWLYSYPDPNKTYTGGKRILTDALR